MRVALVSDTEVLKDEASAEGDAPSEVNAVVGDNLRRLRTRNGLTLERLSKASGVSRAMLGQIELGRSSPTINILWKIAKTLDVPLSVFVSQFQEGDITILRAYRSKWLSSPNGRVSSRTLSPTDNVFREELAEVRLAPQSMEEDDGHSPGSVEYVVVVKGVVEIRSNGMWHRLDKGDSAKFTADRPHAYRNPGLEETLFFTFKISPSLRK